MMNDYLVSLIKQYYEYRGLKYPDVWKSLAFAQTELAEVYELLLDREGGWVRNNPQNKPKFNKEDLAKELGDILMMVIVAGISEDVDPVEALKQKINKKMGINTYQQATFVSSVEVE